MWSRVRQSRSMIATIFRKPYIFLPTQYVFGENNATVAGKHILWRGVTLAACVASFWVFGTLKTTNDLNQLIECDAGGHSTGTN